MNRRDPERSLSVPLRLLERGPITWSATVPAADLAEADDGDRLRIADVEVPSDSEVDVELTLELISGGLSAAGHITAGWRGPCARCWIPLDGQACANVREVFAATPREGEQYRLHPEHADLAPMVREAILLELPIEAIACPYPDPCPNHPPDLDQATDEHAHDDPAEQPDPRWAPLEALRRGQAESP
ncbi:YceD family protein [Candidatus Poriferisodalis sp.]|uniref:YceD family protein n=1 Tax=Candidatus Poriferisodalis sp. TaxID=3101277 RepID=UPI003B01AC1F